MRFIESPLEASVGSERSYFVRVTEDSGLPLLADRLGVKLYNAEQLDSVPRALHPSACGSLRKSVNSANMSMRSGWRHCESPFGRRRSHCCNASFGAAELLVVRDTFKIPYMMVLYTIFVLAATFHAFNGMWTFMITWGVTLSQRSQRLYA